MLTILKKTPITFKGFDCLEVLVKDDNLKGFCPCEKCIYRNYVPDIDIAATCYEVHNCGRTPNTYFIFQIL